MGKSDVSAPRYEISELSRYNEVNDKLLMHKCLAVKSSLNGGVYMLMEPKAVIPIYFKDNKIVQNREGLVLMDQITRGWSSRSKVFNIKEIGARTVAVSYLDNPNIDVFRPREKYRILAP